MRLNSFVNCLIRVGGLYLIILSLVIYFGCSRYNEKETTPLEPKIEQKIDLSSKSERGDDKTYSMGDQNTKMVYPRGARLKKVSEEGAESVGLIIKPLERVAHDKFPNFEDPRSIREMIERSRSKGDTQSVGIFQLPWGDPPDELLPPSGPPTEPSPPPSPPPYLNFVYGSDAYHVGPFNYPYLHYIEYVYSLSASYDHMWNPYNIDTIAVISIVNVMRELVYENGLSEYGFASFIGIDIKYNYYLAYVSGAFIVEIPTFDQNLMMLIDRWRVRGEHYFYARGYTPQTVKRTSGDDDTFVFFY